MKTTEEKNLNNKDVINNYDDSKENVASKPTTKKRDRDYVWAVFLVVIGSVLLANSFGVLSWEIWLYVWRFWPILIVLGGIQLLIGKSLISRLVITVLSFVFIGFAVFISLVSLYKDTDLTKPRYLSWVNVNRIESLISRSGTKLEDRIIINEEKYPLVQKRTLNIEIGASDFEVSSDNELQDILLIESEYYKEVGEPKINERYSNNELNIDFTTYSRNIFFPTFGLIDSVSHRIFLGNPTLNTDIDLKLGAGNGVIDFKDQLNLGDINLVIGAGKLEMTLESGSLPSQPINVDVGAGSIVIKLPKESEATIDYEVGAGQVVIGDEVISGIGKNGVYTTDNFNDSETYAEFIVKVGAGKVEIQFE